MYCPMPFGATKAARPAIEMEMVFSWGDPQLPKTSPPETSIVREGRTLAAVLRTDDSVSDRVSLHALWLFSAFSAFQSLTRVGKHKVLNRGGRKERPQSAQRNPVNH